MIWHSGIFCLALLCRQVHWPDSVDEAWATDMNANVIFLDLAATVLVIDHFATCPKQIVHMDDNSAFQVVASLQAVGGCLMWNGGEALLQQRAVQVLEPTSWCIFGSIHGR